MAKEKVSADLRLVDVALVTLRIENRALPLIAGSLAS